MNNADSKHLAAETDNHAPISAQIAQFAAGLRFEAIPERTREYAKDLMLDSIGIAFASTCWDFAHKTHSALAGLSDGAAASTVIGMPTTLGLRDAALMNAVLVHGLDYDDTHLAGIVHVSSSMLPCVLAMGERRRSTGMAMLTAYIAGIEVAGRIGIAANNQLHQAGFHATGVCGAFGAAIAAGRLLQMTAQQYIDAQGIALSAASGSLEFISEGAWTKRLNPGFAAVAGINAAHLARQGFVGPTRPYEGRDGLFNAYLGARIAKADVFAAARGLGTTWETDGVAIKPIPACHYAHGAADAAIQIHRQFAFDPADVEDVEVRVPVEVFPTICEPWQQKLRPRSGYDAKFSLPYMVSVGLLKGRCGVAEFDDTAVNDEAVLEFAKRIRYAADLESAFPEAYSGEVLVRLRDGTILRNRQQANRGSPLRPLTRKETTEKFMENATMAIHETRARNIAALVARLDSILDVNELAQLLRD